MTSRHVDYESVAADFVKRRSPTQEVLTIWGREVRPHMQDVEIAVDLGAGAGGFSSALIGWGATFVVAVEPSAAMQAEAPHVERVHRVRARAEQIPLPSGSTDLVWISTAIHHFEDLREAVRECRRVLDEQGHVVIRGFVPGHTELGWLALFPGSDKAVARFPSLDVITSAFTDAGFQLVHDSLVEEGTQTYAERAEFSAKMRHADSILTAMSDAEVDTGIAELRSRGSATIEHFVLSCLVFGSA